jgi:hypothetical protein
MLAIDSFEKKSKKQNKDGQSLASLFRSPHAGVSSVPPGGGQLN